MKKVILILVLGLLLAGCAYDVVQTQTAEEFDQMARARGYAYTARAQPVSWITANGLVEHNIVTNNRRKVRMLLNNKQMILLWIFVKTGEVLQDA